MESKEIPLLVRSARSLRIRILGLLCISPDPKQDPEYLAAKHWADNAERPHEDPKSLARSALVNEFADKDFKELVETYNRSSDQCQSLLRDNAALIVGVFAFFKYQQIAMPWLLKLALVSWLISMLLAALGTRRLWRPGRPSISELQDFTVSKDNRLHAWLNVYLHLAIVELRILINNESRIMNYSLMFTFIGLTLLLISTLFS